MKRGRDTVAPLRSVRGSAYSGRDEQGTQNERLGFPPLARLWQRQRGSAGAAVRPDGLQRTRGDCPAPKSPNSPERWMFCQAHAAEYNSGWDYFAGLTAEEAAARESSETRDNSGYHEAAHYGWAGSGDGSRSRDEMRALELLELDPDADSEAMKKAWRAKAKLVHPDVRPGDADAAKAFQALQLAYEVLRAAEERRAWGG